MGPPSRPNHSLDPPRHGLNELLAGPGFDSLQGILSSTILELLWEAPAAIQADFSSGPRAIPFGSSQDWGQASREA